MRPVSSRWRDAVAITHGVACRVRAQRGGAFGPDVPVLAGQITFDATATGRRRLSLTVPLYGPDGFRWDPTGDPLHPLATYGQRLVVSLGVVYPDGTQELVPQGSFLITGVTTDEADGIVTLQGSDLLQLMTEQKIFLASDSVLPLATDTHLTVVEKLMWPALHSPSLQDVKILPTQYDTLPVFSVEGTTVIRDGSNRLDIIDDVVASWGAEYYVNDAGQLHFGFPKTVPAQFPDVTVTAGLPDSTITGAGRSQDRRRAYNAVKVSGRDSADGTTSGAARAYLTSGPLDVHGPNGWVGYWYSSPYISSNAHAQSIADQLLTTGTLYTRTERISCVPDPSIELGDTARVVAVGAGPSDFTGLVASITIPLTEAGGPMTMDVTNEAKEP